MRFARSRRRQPGHLFFVLCLLFALIPAAFAANDRGLFYRAERGAAVIYLLGSIHLGDDAMYPLRSSIESTFAQTDALVVELDITAIDPLRMTRWMAANGQYPPGESLRDHLQPQTWQRLSAYLQKQSLPIEAMQRYKAGILVNMLTMMQLTQTGLSSALGLDQHFLLAAHADKKSIIELETAEDQLALLASMPNSDALINQTLDEIEDIGSARDELFDAWRTGDSAQLEKEINKELRGDNAASREFFARIFTRRNQAMTTRIAAESNTHRHLFVVVGAGHLLGSDGVVALLRRQGFKIEQL